MIETLIFAALAVADIALVVAAVVFGRRPLASVFRALGRNALRFFGTFLGVLMLLTILIPVIDASLYARGVVLPDDFMIYFAPAFMLVLSLAVAMWVVWRTERVRAR